MSIRKPKKTPKNAPDSLKKDNSIGNTENRINRLKAKESLKSAKELELERVGKGFRWVTDGKINKFVAPERIEHYIYNGYRVVNP